LTAGAKKNKRGHLKTRGVVPNCKNGDCFGPILSSYELFLRPSQELRATAVRRLAGPGFALRREKQGRGSRGGTKGGGTLEGLMGRRGHRPQAVLHSYHGTRQERFGAPAQGGWTLGALSRSADRAQGIAGGGGRGVSSRQSWGERLRAGKESVGPPSARTRLTGQLSGHWRLAIGGPGESRERSGSGTAPPGRFSAFGPLRQGGRGGGPGPPCAPRAASPLWSGGPQTAGTFQA